MQGPSNHPRGKHDGLVNLWHVLCYVLSSAIDLFELLTYLRQVSFRIHFQIILERKNFSESCDTKHMTLYDVLLKSVCHVVLAKLGLKKVIHCLGIMLTNNTML